MRLVTWTDDAGYTRRVFIRNKDFDHEAAEIGVPNDPPNLNKLDWDTIGAQLPDLNVSEFKRGLHNRLSKFGLITWADAQRSQNGITSAIMAVGRDRKILAVVKRPLIMLYKTAEV